MGIEVTHRTPDSPTVSVLLPTLNASDTIEGALESLAAQSYEDYEVLVVDDGSTDGTPEVAESFREREFDGDKDRLRVIEGTDGPDTLAAALNHAGRVARGKFIARQDADDWSAPTRFGHQVALLDHNENVAAVGTGAHIISPRGTPRQPRAVLSHPTLRHFKETNRFVHGSVMMRTDALRSVGGYDERFESSEDLDLWLRLSERYTLRNINQPLYTLILNSGSVYGSELLKTRMYGHLAVLRSEGTITDEDLDALLDQDAEPDEVLSEVAETDLSDLYADLANEALRYHDRREAVHLATKALREGLTNSGAWAGVGLSALPTAVIDTAIDVVRSRQNRDINLRNLESNSIPGPQP